MTGATFPFPFSKHLQICIHLPKLFGSSCIMAQLVTTLFVRTIQVFILETSKHTTLSIVMFKRPALAHKTMHTQFLYTGESSEILHSWEFINPNEKGLVGSVMLDLAFMQFSAAGRGGVANFLFSTKQRNGVSLRRMQRRVVKMSRHLTGLEGATMRKERSGTMWLRLESKSDGTHVKQINIGVAYVVKRTLQSDVAVVHRSIIARRLIASGHGSTMVHTESYQVDFGSQTRARILLVSR